MWELHDWLFAAEGAIIHPGARVAVIADVHLGYEWARGHRGDCVPAHALAETLAKLERTSARATIDRLIVAGDLIESPAPCARTAADVRALTAWLHERGIALTVLAGNHDLPFGHRSQPAETLEIAGWTIGHGHRPIAGARTISGHHHPILHIGNVCAPCFLAGPTTIVLPAFSPNAAGWNVARGLIPPAWRSQDLRCIAGTGGELLDFGPWADLVKRSQR